VATGDGGSAGTLATPATDPNVIAAGASTQFRLYAQTGLLPFATGYVSGNMASFSSGGLAESRPRTVDVVAPGDLGWALCSPSSLYTECWGFPYLVFGGTSEAAPLTAGASALVIQAYRSTHGGQSPSPALVKSILQSTASDLGAPSDEQGAGIIDALAAVNEALAVRDAAGASRRRAARACWRRPTPSRSRRGRATRCRAPSSSRTPARPRWTCSRRSSSSARRSPGRRFRWR
jgi:subtilisin family serine protease